MYKQIFQNSIAEFQYVCGEWGANKSFWDAFKKIREDRGKENRKGWGTDFVEVNDGVNTHAELLNKRKQKTERENGIKKEK